MADGYRQLVPWTGFGIVCGNDEVKDGVSERRRLPRDPETDAPVDDAHYSLRTATDRWPGSGGLDGIIEEEQQRNNRKSRGVPWEHWSNYNNIGGKGRMGRKGQEDPSSSLRYIRSVYNPDRYD